MTIGPLAADDPERIGRYRLLGVLADEPGTRSFLGIDLDRRAYVVRQFAPPLVTEPEFRARLRHSAVAAMRITGSGNTIVVDVGADDEDPWRAALFVPSVPLDRVIADHGPLPEPALRALAAGLATALRAVHAAGFAHGRVGLDTVALTRDGVRLAEITIPPPGGERTSADCSAPEENTETDPVWSMGCRAPDQSRSAEPTSATGCPTPTEQDASVAPALSMDCSAPEQDTWARPAPGVDCHVPERDTCGEPTPAADIYAVGVVLACAASGSVQLGHRSVSPESRRSPDGREPLAACDGPDLSGVPDSMRELTAACLRGDPAARHTPAQLLGLLGAMPAEPPWSASILDAVDAQAREVLDRVAAAPPVMGAEAERRVQSRMPEAASRTTQFGSRTVESVRRRARQSTLLLRWGSGIAVAALVLAVGAFALTTHDEQRRTTVKPSVVTGLSLDQLRRIDACAWLGTALGDAVPVAPAALPKASWKLTGTSSWGCRATSDGYQLELDIGVYLTGFTPEQTMVDGITLRHSVAGRCARAIAAAGTDSASGITIELSPPATVKDCAGIDYVAANVARTLTDAPIASRPGTTLALLAPCELLTREVVTKAIGPTPAQPSVADAHTCVWDGGVELTVRLAASGIDLTGSGRTIVVDGVRMYLDTGDSLDTCSRAYPDPISGSETVSVLVAFTDGTRAMNCPIAEAMLRVVVGGLPER
ncbi:hypothetical protein ACFXG4_44475 [Nocardia sp. NPDC059246]|uniref:hypothetical protein n=1 Tax=unclassified Nocardia TaxID=2637762 RepID=UPI00368A97B3